MILNYIKPHIRACSLQSLQGRTKRETTFLTMDKQVSYKVVTKYFHINKVNYAFQEDSKKRGKLRGELSKDEGDRCEKRKMTETEGDKGEIKAEEM